jgi:serine/threonine protein kinase/tetratricopeptide (TPR) repeat protein
MTADTPSCDSIFCAAVEIASDADRAAYIARECGDDAELRAQVEKLVDAHFRAGSFLEAPILGATWPLASAPLEVPTLTERPGTVIGPYKLLQQIGEGGMGLVFMAEQTQPVQRKVALKVIKPGMDSSQVIARFEAERQALALMDHVNIARVLDAGATESGRPFFVMELVHGVPITKYCDDNQLTPRQRLELFVSVCKAIQHAHQKGIIHRDIKPSNVMVTLYDGKPAPKVIDFGVAKATEQKLTERTLFTHYGAMVGTFEYMSPEQAGMSALGVDTRSDIFSLGVLLYELLTGGTPMSHKRVTEADYADIVRMIKEEEPPKPSTRLSDSGAALASIAAQLRMEPAKLSKLMRGELDWIVMKTLEKDRNRRYDTANGLAADVQRYLKDEPVQACPPSTWYRLRKFARRNTRAVVGVLAVTLAILLTLVILAVSNVLIRQEQVRTTAEKDRAKEAQKLADTRAEQIRQDLEHLRGADVLLDRGRWYAVWLRWDDAHAAFTKAIEIRPDHASALDERGGLYVQLGLWDLAAADFAREFQLREPDTSTRWFQLALLSVHLGDQEGCRQVCRGMRVRFGGTVNSTVEDNLIRACVLDPDPGDDSAARAELAHRLVAGDPTFFHLYLLGIAEYRAGRHEEAVRRLQEALKAYPAWPMPYPVLAMARHRLGQAAEARQALESAERVLDQWTRERYEKQEDSWFNHLGATAFWPVGWWDYLECQHYYREAKLLIDGSPPPDDTRLHALRARAFAGLRQPSRAEVEYAEVLKAWPQDRQIRFEAHVNRAESLRRLGQWRQAAGELAQANELQPDAAFLWLYRAVALLAAGDVDAYRQTCASMIQHFEKTEDARTACYVLMACVLRDDALADTAPLPRLARVAARAWHFGGYVRTAALYRAGQYEESVRCFEAEAKAFRPRPWDWCFLAMGHSRLGHADEARRCLAEAAAWTEEANQQDLDDVTGTRRAWGGWDEPVVYPLLVREAEALLREAEQKPLDATRR